MGREWKCCQCFLSENFSFILQAEVRQNVATQLNRWISIGFLPRYRASQFLTILDGNKHGCVLRSILIKPQQAALRSHETSQGGPSHLLTDCNAGTPIWARATPT
jgi:hypothetical protein